MSEPKYTIYNKSGEQVAWSRHGVMWKGDCEERLGEFYDNKIYDNSHKEIAYVQDDTVYFSESGTDLGAAALVKEKIEIGKCFPKNHKVAADGIILLGEDLA
ncbi:MAG: hypothetical protein O7D86_06505 [Proteobacteria bacterium]|nr:hypothetical protein [Pseudomonadota bacterium]